MSLIRCENLTKIYGSGESETRALDGASAVIEAGEFVAIMGPSGSGKSTFMQILGLLDHPTSGEYALDGKDTKQFDDETLAFNRNQKIGFIFQAFNLLSRLSVTENTELPLLYNFYGKRLSQKERSKRVHDALKSVSLDHRAGHTPNQLSGGEKQRAAIARALVNDPQILFADEPTGNLDSTSGHQVMEILQGLNDQGRTIILVTHEAATAKHAKRILSMMDGKLVSDEQIIDRTIARDNGSLGK